MNYIKAQFKSYILFVIIIQLFGCTKSNNTSNQSNQTSNTPTLPVLSTNVISDITTTSAKVGGVISSNGGAQITEKGICWSTSHNPSKLDSSLNDGSNSNTTIILDLSHLSPKTTYYVRAYAINKVGIAYGDEQVFETMALPDIWTSVVNDNRFFYITSFMINDSIIVASSYNNGIYVSSNKGISWIKGGGTPSPMVVNSFLFSGPNILAAADVDGIWKSFDGGLTWERVNTGLPNYIQAFSFTKKDINIYVTAESGIYKSSDNGNSWSFVNPIMESAIIALGNDILASGENLGGVSISSDNGATWLKTSTNFNVTISTLDTIGSSIYGGTYGGGAYLSKDYAKTWSPVNGIASNYATSSFVRKGTTIYAATSAGAFISTDNGLTWVLYNEGLTQGGNMMSKLIISGGRIYAALYNKGLFYRPL